MWNSDWQRDGQEPDYRFSLANERTFLAWIRTALALLAGGVLLEQVPLHGWTRQAVLAMASSLLLLAAVVAALAYPRWRNNEIAMRHGRGLPATAMFLLLALALAVVGAALMIRLWW